MAAILAACCVYTLAVFWLVSPWLLGFAFPENGTVAAVIVSVWGMMLICVALAFNRKQPPEAKPKGSGVLFWCVLGMGELCLSAFGCRTWL